MRWTGTVALMLWVPAPMAFAEPPPPHPAPAGAVMLFDGRGLAAWAHPDGSAPAWTVADGAVTIVPKPGSGGLQTKDNFRDFQLHVEFLIPEPPRGAKGQDRSNSGVYLLRRYEIQILDVFGKAALEPGDCASVYKQKPPDANASRPTGQWQSYDIAFRSPRWDAAGKKTENARITVFWNGVLVHNNVEIAAKTGAGDPETPEPGPILLQDHGNPVKFRNVWVVPGP